MAAHLVLYLEEHKPGIAYDIIPGVPAFAAAAANSLTFSNSTF